MPSKFTTLLSVILLAGALPYGFASPAQTLEVRSVCGTHISREEQIAVEKRFQADKVVPRAVSDFQSQQAATIQVFWHVIAKDNTPAGGNIPDGSIQQQIAVLNQEYARSGTGLSWQLVGIDRTINADWYSNVADGSPQEKQMKTALRKGNVATFNVYSVGNIPGSAYFQTGFTSFPWDYNNNPQDDGTVLNYLALPGGPYPSVNQGKALVHEAGHWAGLFHTFEGGCAAPGDYVDDTPYQASASSGCPSGRDTCPQPGLDPINNYMDFSDDACRNQFTPGQVARMRQQLGQYRGLQI